MQTETLIIGGGLCGLRIAQQLSDQGHDFQLVEARERFGGRILSTAVGGGAYDLGPAWFWPGQPRIEALINDLNLKRFDQYADGILTFEDERGQVSRGRGFASMAGSYRLQGGLGALVGAIAKHLPPERVHLGTPITRLYKTHDGVAAQSNAGQVFEAQKIILALPPRIASQCAFEPRLTDAAHLAMDEIATWMAGQAKAIAFYETPFWREDGLSGDAMSRHGPMVEVHDASPATNGPAALFGFIGVPPAARRDADGLRQAVLSQLVRLFGPDATTPMHLTLKDWAFDPLTATEADQLPLLAHPTYGMPHALRDLWDGRLLFSGTETATTFGGYLEGALEAAENALFHLETEKV